MIEDLFQPSHLLFIALVALIVLGPAKLGDVGGALGRSIREFRENATPADTPERSEKPERVPTEQATGVTPEPALKATANVVRAPDV